MKNNIETWQRFEIIRLLYFLSKIYIFNYKTHDLNYYKDSNSIKNCILKQKSNLTEVIDIMNRVKDLVQTNENVLIDYEEQSNRLQLTR